MWLAVQELKAQEGREEIDISANVPVWGLCGVLPVPGKQGRYLQPERSVLPGAAPQCPAPGEGEGWRNS